MTSTTHASLFVSTYDMPRHLELVLAGLQKQSYLGFELLICDDGSSADTKKVIERFQARARFPVKHFWQEHLGFRKCRILNRALREAVGRVAIFLDGDCIPHRDFVRDHVEQQAMGYYLAGRRVELDRLFSEALTPELVEAGFFDRPRWSLFWSALVGQTEHINRTFRVRHPLLRSLLKYEQVDDLKGCNYSVALEDLKKINGFDEAYEGYGREDTDVEIRLQNLGLKIKSLKGLALQYHVWHERRVFTPANDNRLDEVKNQKKIRCQQGLYLDPEAR